jgi:hypothetical protein
VSGAPYVTFFLCGHDWSLGFDAFDAPLESLLRLFSLERQATVLAHVAPGSPSAGRKRSGRYERQALSRWPADALTVSVPAAPGRFRFFARLEGARYRHTPEYVRWLDPTAPAVCRDLEGQRIATFSFEASLVARPPRATEVVRAVEALFLDLGCIYAYGRPMLHFTVSEYHPVQTGRNGLLRVIDVDYRRRIENVYLHNWLSASHLSVLPDPDAALRAAAAVRRFDDGHGGLRGVYLGTEGSPDGAVAELRRGLAPLLVQAPPRRRETLIVGPDGVRRMGLDALRGAFPGTDTVLWPGDVAAIGDLDAPAHADVLAFQRALERVLRGTRALEEPLRPAPECLIEFASPFDPYHLYRRFVRGPGDEDAAKLRTGRIGDRAALPVCLIARRRDDALAALETLAAWTGRVNAAPEVHGALAWSEPPSVRARGTVHCAQGVMDASRLDESAFALLAVLLDRQNAARCAVAYAVVGAIDAHA